MKHLKSKPFVLFIILLLHITLLDLVLITYNGAIILVDKSIELKTILTHLAIVGASVGSYFGLNVFLDFYRQPYHKASDYMWVAWSVVLVLMIGFMLI